MESEKAVVRHMRPRILNICSVVTSVLRPCRMMAVHGITLGSRAVKGAAMLASPGLTICGESSCSSRSSHAAIALPWPPASVAFAAPLAPFSSCGAGVPPLRPGLAPFRVLGAAGSSAGAGGAGALRPGLAAAAPLRRRAGTMLAESSATPMWAAFRLPTSLVPSPHMSVTRPAFFRVVMMSSFWSGEVLANTWVSGTRWWRQPARCACAMASPARHRSCPAARAAISAGAALNGSRSASSGLTQVKSASDSSFPSAPSCSAGARVRPEWPPRPPPLVRVRMSAGRSMMCSASATWQAVSAASPVIITRRWLEALSMRSAGSLSGLMGHRKTARAPNVSPLSASSRLMPRRSADCAPWGSWRYASAMMRAPCEAKRL
mmetsp:Transcript_12932/g.33211  ORF Transcript_12932/g.33211 Transcript_12932/m.33211 type:complete len:377 (+) Transcript_12932:835-1965(+)